jgi:hypothetical protein
MRDRLAAADSRRAGTSVTQIKAARLPRALMWIALWSPALAMGGADLQMPPPDPQAQPYRDRLVALIEGQYPQLLTQKIAGTAMVTVLFDSDGTLLASNLEVVPAAVTTLTASEMQFARFGLAADDLKYIGTFRIPLPPNTIVVVFGARDSRKLDLALVEHFFPKVLAQGVPPGFGIWILFDHDGKVLRTGEERFESQDLRKVLETRFPNIRTSDITIAHVDGPLRKGLQLHCVWLANGSPLPEP